MEEQDPFLIVKSQVEDSLANANNLFESWKRIQQTVSSPKNQELLWTADELGSALEAIEQDLDDLEEAFMASQANPSQFNLTQKDLSSRRRFLDNSRNRIQSIRNTLANPPAKNNSNKHLANQSIETIRQNENSRFIESEQQQQTVMIQEQDHHLDAMGSTLINLKEIAGTMNREIDDHVILLDDLGERVDRSEGRLKTAMRRVTDILKKEEESKSGYCICCLIIVLIILLVLVIIM
ncbi:hypothetical protein BCV72DRAFT_218067 [Rhizopus microsporus var. microsporus]|uniref:t-SNARE coiled-coil homology domain-containing protein n=2 Tax=Rhizopus microsporus TaxID=58291 RepID=A0A2G4SIT6_RHIZD|nr:uncharacterized protein RHIMIDRAFT_72156 [Rhizopus microsporus ATCC 52813]ORE01026.1 hypothetical protein BCV72DRAFT_218067 [Rhizopus microsporus var. microsporus]PHZ08685.1 hypothetical protein RHIMIDRAFT_72156 [Rhizopus microsporus ATCC 52813]